MPVDITLIYDPACPLCRRFRDTVARWDTGGRVALVTLDDADLTVLDGAGAAHRGPAALQRLTEVLPGVRRLAWAYRLPGVTALVGAVYRRAQRQRSARRPCLQCGERWLPSRAWSRRR